MSSPALERSAERQPIAATALPQHIRLFHERDAAAVAEIFNDSEEGWPGGFMRGVPMTAVRVLRRQREQQPLATFIAWEGECAAGYCSFFEHPEERGAAGFIGLLNVATSYQGRGYGRDLLKAALAHAGALGYGRVDLGTWPGNMKAVPLYKKAGFFWVPETYVHMENYVPLLLAVPALADFWAEADWYATQVRDLAVREDLIERDGMRIYPYEFRHGDRFVTATIDATTHGLTALETEHWRVACTIEQRTLIAGRPGRVRWDVENRTGHPLPLTLLAGAGAGLHLSKEATVQVDERYVTEAPLDADLDVQRPAFGRQAPRVESLLLLGGQPIHLETGVEVRRPFSVQFEAPRASVQAGQRRELELQVRNAMEEPAVAHLAIVPSPGLIVETAATEEGSSDGALQLALPLEPKGASGARLQITAARAGAHTLEVRPTAKVAGTAVPMAPVWLPLPAVAPGEMVAISVEKPDSTEYLEHEVRVESSTHRLIVDLREGGWHLQDAGSGEELAGGLVGVGPPLRWNSQAQVRHTPAIEQRGGATAVTLRGALPHLPHAAVEHEFLLAPDGLLRMQTTITAASATLEDAQAAVWLWTDAERRTSVAIPTAYGLVESDEPEWPEWSDPALQDPALFSEGWIAHQYGPRVTGLLWSDAHRVELEGWRASVLHDASGLAQGERRTLPAVYVYAGPGDRRTVRAQWRRLLQPDADPRDPDARPVVQLASTAMPSALFVGAHRLELSSLASRDVTGTLTFEGQDGWHVEPATHTVRGLRAGREPAAIDVVVRRHGTGPAAASVRARLRTERAESTVFDGALLHLGEGDGVQVEETTRAGRRVLRVDNGYLRLSLAPDYIGSVIALETADGINHLHSSFPEPREFGWMRPWYGGIHTALYGSGWDGFPGHARLFEESLEVDEVEIPGAERRWRGLLVRAMLKGQDRRGLELRAAYLTLPGSNLLAIQVAVRNHTGATLRAQPAVAAYLQPDGTVEGAELLTERAGQDRRLLRAQRTTRIPAGRWAAARNPATGRTLALVGGARGADLHIVGEDWGDLGAHAGALAAMRLGPGDEQRMVAFLAVARDEVEARAYRVLADARELL